MSIGGQVPQSGHLVAAHESDPVSHQLGNQAILVLEHNGPAEGRPLVDTITASRVAKMKELRPQWDKCYRAAIPRAEKLYEEYLAG
jgi:hypothetical protein